MANPKRRLAAPGALYLYGISRGPGAKAAKKPAPKLAPKLVKIGSAGIDGVHAVRPLACGEFVCWVCEVDQASFAQAVERNMENLEWLALHGVRHQQVVGEVAAQVAIVPARFGTIFSGEPALLKDVQGRKAALTRVFARVAGGDEWGVKVFAERPAAAAAVTKARSGKRVSAAESGTLAEAPGAQRSGTVGTSRRTRKDCNRFCAQRKGKRSATQPALAGDFSRPARQAEAVGRGAEEICAAVGRAAAHRNKWALAAILVCL